MSTSLDTIIIGAGPFALSLGAHLEDAGLDYCIYGEVMGAWKKLMPPGMMLKSWPCSSNIDDPHSKFTLQQFCVEQGVDYDDVMMPLPVELFHAYGEAFATRMNLKIKQKMLVRLTRDEQGFVAGFDDGDSVRARHVVLAVGVHPFKYIPGFLAHLPGELLSHSGDYGPIDGLRGKNVAVLGAGASASGLAALISEAGATATLIAREPELHFADPPFKAEPDLKQRIADAIYPVRGDCVGVAAGPLMDLWAQAPLTFHLMPERQRLRVTGTSLGPSGHCSMKDRVYRSVNLLLGRAVETAEAVDGKVRLALRGRDGRRESFEADHVIAATGFRTDLDRLAFLADDLKSAIRTEGGTPVLSRNYESSAPGLFFVGPATANSFGPVMRFVAGARHSSRAVTRRLRRSPHAKPAESLRPVEIARRTP
jgi:cation diffusion facilitator CzcD-associated flavoprotein CzcO